MTTTLPLSDARSRKKSGTKIRPIESTSASTAPPNIKRLNPRLSACNIDDWESFSEIFFHSLMVNRNRQLSSPGVTTTFFPIYCLNFTGSDSRFLSSMVWVYSPINICMMLIYECMRMMRIKTVVTFLTHQNFFVATDGGTHMQRK